MKEIQLLEVMTPQPITVNTENTLAEVHVLLKENHIHHIPVVDHENRVVGILSKSDMDQLSWGITLFKIPNREDYNDALYHTRRVKDIMTKDVSILKQSDTINQAYDVFRKRDFRAIPIVDGDKLVGIVSPIDLVKPFIHNSN